MQKYIDLPGSDGLKQHDENWFRKGYVTEVHLYVKVPHNRFMHTAHLQLHWKINAGLNTFSLQNENVCLSTAPTCFCLPFKVWGRLMCSTVLACKNGMWFFFFSVNESSTVQWYSSLLCLLPTTVTVNPYYCLWSKSMRFSCVCEGRGILGSSHVNVIMSV